MASHLRDNILHGRDHTDTHVSANRWRHHESGSFARHASAAPRLADERDGSKDLADFLNSSRVAPPASAGSEKGEKHKPIMVGGNAHNGTTEGQSLDTQYDGGASGGKAAQVSDNGLKVRCGPLLNYRRMENETWFGSVLIITIGGGVEGDFVPELQLRIIGGAHTAGAGSEEELRKENGVYVNNASEARNQPYGGVSVVDSENGPDLTPTTHLPSPGTHSNGTANGAGRIKVRGTKLYSDPSNTFWRFDLRVPMEQTEIQCEYTIPGLSFPQDKKTDRQSFFIPAISESFRIMFHSCNGFSVGTDEEAWSGPALWNDVLRVHKKTPFHVM